jgi:hypothetical protein
MNFIKPKPHVTERINVKGGSADVDKEIVPVVSWLNSYDNVATQYSCQGDDALNIKPHVLFTCDLGSEDFYNINVAIEEFDKSAPDPLSYYNHVIVRSDSHRGKLRFHIEFRDTVVLRKFVDFLTENCQVDDIDPEYQVGDFAKGPTIKEIAEVLGVGIIPLKIGNNND